MRGFQVVVCAVALLFISACSKSSGGTAAPAKAFAVPADITLKIPPYQALSSDEYNQFLTFLTSQDLLQRFAPQDYMFSNADRSQLTAPQANLLAEINNVCLSAEVPTNTKLSSAKVGASELSTDAKNIGSSNCPILYYYQSNSGLTIQAIDQEAQSIGASGTIAIDEALSASDPTAMTTMNEGAQTVAVRANYDLQMDPAGTRLFLDFTRNENMISQTGDGGYKTTIAAQIMMQTEDQSKPSLLALNLTITSLNMDKAIVISMITPAGVQPDATNTAAIINGAELTDADLVKVLSSAFVQRQIATVTAVFGSSSTPVGNASKALSALVHK